MSGLNTQWKFTVSKDEFKRRMESGDIERSIKFANEMVNDLFSGKKQYDDARYKGTSKKKKISWLKDHIKDLNDGIKIINKEEKMSKEERFIDKFFDIRVDDNNNGTVSTEPQKA